MVCCSAAWWLQSVCRRQGHQTHLQTMSMFGPDGLGCSVGYCFWWALPDSPCALLHLTLCVKHIILNCSQTANWSCLFRFICFLPACMHCKLEFFELEYVHVSLVQSILCISGYDHDRVLFILCSSEQSSSKLGRQILWAVLVTPEGLSKRFWSFGRFLLYCKCKTACQPTVAAAAALMSCNKTAWQGRRLEAQLNVTTPAWESVITHSFSFCFITRSTFTGQHHSDWSWSEPFWLILFRQAYFVCSQCVQPLQPTLSCGQYRLQHRRASTFIRILGNCCSCFQLSNYYWWQLFHYRLASAAIIGAEVSCTKFWERSLDICVCDRRICWKLSVCLANAWSEYALSGWLYSWKQSCFEILLFVKASERCAADGDSSLLSFGARFFMQHIKAAVKCFKSVCLYGHNS